MTRFRLLSGPIPLHHQVYLDLRAAIQAGEWKPGEQIPPERELAERYGCSLITVRRALGDLARERRIERARGRGTFVSRQPINLDLDGTLSFTEELHHLGHDPSTRVVAARTLPAEAVVAEALGIAVGASVVHLERLRMADGEPLLLEPISLRAREAQLLGVEPHRPALLIEGVAFDRDGMPVEFARSYVRGDRTRYYVERVVIRSGPQSGTSATGAG